MKSMKLLVVGWSVAAAAMPVPSPTSVAAEIAAHGAKRTVDGLIQTKRWDAVTTSMDKGSGAWIALAPKLAPGSDAGSAEDLGLSLALALPVNPRAVLAAIDAKDGPILGLSRVCGRPFIEDSEPAGYQRRALSALSRITDQHLTAIAGRCRTALLAR